MYCQRFKPLLWLSITPLIFANYPNIKGSTKDSLPEVSLTLAGKAYALKSGGESRIVYDIIVKNNSTKTLILQRVTSTDTNGVLVTESGKKLAKNLSRIYSAPDRVSRLKRSPVEYHQHIYMKPGSTLLYFGWHALNNETLSFKVEYAWKQKSFSQEMVIKPLKKTITPVSSPVSGSNWYAFDAPENTARHRRAMYYLNKEWLSPQRFAIDFIKTNEKGERYAGPTTFNSSYFAYGMSALAVTVGTIVRVVDGIEENQPGCQTAGSSACKFNKIVKMSEKTLAGNTVTLKTGPTTYITYAHLIPGSIPVKVGDKVNTGDVLGKIGNSGNSREPHLHIHACNRPSVLACDGLPIYFERFVEIPIDTLRGPIGQPVLRRGETPINNSIVNFISE